MSTSGIVLLNLENRNAAEFQSIEVPGSYEKAQGAATAGAYITVYKWLYNGFGMTASLCTADDKTSYVSLVDKTNGGELRVYPDDTITLVGSVSPTPPEPEELTFKAYHVYSGSIVEPHTMIVQKGHFVGTEFSVEWTPDDFIEDGEPIELSETIYSHYPYILEGCLAIAYNYGEWDFISTEYAHEYSPGLQEWMYYATANMQLEMITASSQWVGKYYCANTGDPVSE